MGKSAFLCEMAAFYDRHAPRRRLMRIAPHESDIERPLTIAPGPEAQLGVKR